MCTARRSGGLHTGTFAAARCQIHSSRTGNGRGRSSQRHEIPVQRMPLLRAQACLGDHVRPPSHAAYADTAPVALGDEGPPIAPAPGVHHGRGMTGPQPPLAVRNLFNAPLRRAPAEDGPQSRPAHGRAQRGADGLLNPGLELGRVRQGVEGGCACRRDRREHLRLLHAHASVAS